MANQKNQPEHKLLFIFLITNLKISNWIQRIRSKKNPGISIRDWLLCI